MDASTVTTRTATFVGRCKGCKAGARATASEAVKRTVERFRTVQGYDDERTVYRYAYDGSPHFTKDRTVFLHRTCTCGRDVALRRVAGTVTEHVCNAKCMASTGHVCECSCGGKNHGAGLPILAI